MLIKIIITFCIIIINDYVQIQINIKIKRKLFYSNFSI